MEGLAYGADSCCYDQHYRPNYHGTEQRYVSPTTGKCKQLIVQAVHPNDQNVNRTEVRVGANAAQSTKLAVWLVRQALNLPSNPELIPLWLLSWVWFPFSLLIPLWMPRHTGLYPPYLSRFYGQLWVARSAHEYSIRKAQLGVEPVHEITHSTHPRRLVIYDPESRSWKLCTDEETVKQQRYVVISYRYGDILANHRDGWDDAELEAAFITEVEATVASLNMSAYWVDLTLTTREEKPPPEEIDKDVYRMADVYRGAEFTLIMLCPPAKVTENDAWLAYGERLWTFPEALLSRELRYKFRGGEVTPITLHQLANRAYAGFPQESAIINAYGLRDPLERLERLSLLKSALWRRTSRRLGSEGLGNQTDPQIFRADRVYALMGFLEHRIHPHFHETELQALVRLSMANDNDRFVERMVSLLPHQIPDHACWYAEDDWWEANLWDIEPEIQVVGLTAREALVIGGCRTAAIRWKNFPLVAFAVRPSVKRQCASVFPYFCWSLLFPGIILLVGITGLTGTTGSRGTPGPEGITSSGEITILASSTVLLEGGEPTLFIVAIVFLFLSPLFVAYGTSGRVVHAQPWLVGVKGLISAEEASTLMYGGAIYALPRTSYTPTGTSLSQPKAGEFRLGDPKQLDALLPQGPNATVAHDLYTLIDTLSGTIYYFRAARPPTVCLYTGRESGVGRFVLCSENCIQNELHKETVIRMPWYVSQSMPACDWIALG